MTGSPTKTRRDDTRLVFSLVAVAVLAVAGALLIAAGHRGRSPHGQPLPERPFAIGPAAARALADPPAQCRPRSGRAEVDIAALCVSAPLVATRADASGALPVPDDVQRVALDLDTAPLTAASGSTVIAGHVDDANQGEGAFYPLHETRPGTKIVVTGLDGTVTAWKVFQVTSVHKGNLPAAIFRLDGRRQLVLVTCGGPLLYEPGYGNTYADNVLVYATPASPAE